MTDPMDDVSTAFAFAMLDGLTPEPPTPEAVYKRALAKARLSNGPGAPWERSELAQATEARVEPEAPAESPAKPEPSTFRVMLRKAMKQIGLFAPVVSAGPSSRVKAHVRHTEHGAVLVSEHVRHHKPGAGRQRIVIRTPAQTQVPGEQQQLPTGHPEAPPAPVSSPDEFEHDARYTAWHLALSGRFVIVRTVMGHYARFLFTEDGTGDETRGSKVRWFREGVDPNRAPS